MFNIDKCCKPAAFLCLSDNGVFEGRFSGRFGPINFDNTAAGKPSNSKSTVNEQITGGNDVNVDTMTVAKSHNSGFSKIFLYLRYCKIEIFLSRGCKFFLYY
jgi:hypothetical protein